MKASNVQMMNSLQNELQSKGILMSYQTEMMSGMTHVRLKRGQQAVFHTFGDYEEGVDVRIKELCRELYSDDRQDIDALNTELKKYKEVVKQLSFDLEMARTPARAVATEADVRKQTLEMAADFLMDYGVIKTGTELESVCNQMKKLHPSRKAVIQSALDKMNEAFGSKR